MEKHNLILRPAFIGGQRLRDDYSVDHDDLCLHFRRRRRCGEFVEGGHTQIAHVERFAAVPLAIDRID
jgi:hypothetical protein